MQFSTVLEMEKTLTSISLEDLKLEDFNYDTKLPVRMYGLLLTHRQNPHTDYIIQFLVTDLSRNERCSYQFQYYDTGFQFKENVHVEPAQKFSVDLFEKKLDKLNETLFDRFQTRVSEASSEYSTDLFQRKYLVEIEAVIKRYKDQLDVSRAQMFPMTKELLIQRAVTEKDQALINFLNRLKTKISGKWLRDLNSMYGFADIMRRLDGVGYRKDNDSDIIESQALVTKKRKRNGMPHSDVTDPSRHLLASILPRIKRECASNIDDREPGENEEEQSKQQNQQEQSEQEAFIGNENNRALQQGEEQVPEKDARYTSLEADSGNKLIAENSATSYDCNTSSSNIVVTQAQKPGTESNQDVTLSDDIIIETSSHLMVPDRALEQLNEKQHEGTVFEGTVSQIIDHSTQIIKTPIRKSRIVDVVGCYPNDELMKIKNIYTNEIELNDSLEIYVKYQREDLEKDAEYKPVGVIKFKSANDVAKFFDKINDRESLNSIHNNFDNNNPKLLIKQLAIPYQDWQTLFLRSSKNFFIFWSPEWEWS